MNNKSIFGIDPHKPPVKPEITPIFINTDKSSWNTKEWTEVYPMGKYGWVKNNDILLVTRRNLWELELNGRIIFSHEEKDVVFEKAKAFMRDGKL